jgi:hypothetical protein
MIRSTRWHAIRSFVLPLRPSRVRLRNTNSPTVGTTACQRVPRLHLRLPCMAAKGSMADPRGAPRLLDLTVQAHRKDGGITSAQRQATAENAR